MSARPCSGPGTCTATRGAVGNGQRLLALAARVPPARFLVRPTLCDPGDHVLDAAGARLRFDGDGEKLGACAPTRPWRSRVGQSEATPRRQTEHVNTDVQYAAGTWAQARPRGHQSRGRPARRPRAAGHTSAGFVVANLRQTPRFLTSGSTVPAVPSRLGSKSCTTGSRSVGQLLSLLEANQLPSSSPRPMCDQELGCARGPPVLAPR